MSYKEARAMTKSTAYLDLLQKQVRPMSKVTEIIQFFRNHRFTYLGLTSGLPVSFDKNNKIISHPIRLKAQYINIYLNLDTETFMVEPLLRESIP